MLLTDGNLAKLRKTQELNLPETAYIQSLSVTNGADGWSESWQTKVTKPARLGEPKGEQEKTTASTIVGKTTYVVTLPADTDVSDEDRIQINSVDYRVHWTNKNKTNKTALRVLVTEV